MRLGVDDILLKELYHKSSLNSNLSQRELPDLESEIIPLFHRLLLLMTVDGTVHAKEIDLCRKIGLQMGLNLLAIEEILKTASIGKASLLTPEFISNTFKTYYN